IGKTRDLEFRRPILEALTDLGGEGRVSEILALVEKKLADRLTAADFNQLQSGQIRWRNTAEWERKHMLEEGLLARPSRRGIWQITNEGRSWLTRNEAGETAP